MSIFDCYNSTLLETLLVLVSHLLRARGEGHTYKSTGENKCGATRCREQNRLVVPRDFPVV